MSSQAWLSESQWETAILGRSPASSACHSQPITSRRNKNQPITSGQYTNHYRHSTGAQPMTTKEYRDCSGAQPMTAKECRRDYTGVRPITGKYFRDCTSIRPIIGRAVKVTVLVCLVLVSVSPVLGEIRVGGAVNVFSRFGYLSISMRVVPRNDTDHSWIFREPIVDVFKQVVIRQSLTKSGSGAGSGSASQPVFQGDFHMEFCDNTRQLLQAYFRDFTIEKMEHPWQAFTSSWSPAIIARNLGIDATHVSSDSGDTRYCFVLVRVARHRESASVASDQSRDQSQSQLQDAVAQQMARVTVGDAASVGEFVRSFGSHYVASYTTGNSLYQVFVYTPIIYKRIKDRLKSRGITSLSTGELNSYFSPWYAEHTGKVLSASGNATMEKWALHNLRVSFYFFNYPSLLKIHGDTALLKQLNNLLQNEALLQLELKTLAPAFNDAEKRKWFEEVVENNMILWDVNM